MDCLHCAGRGAMNEIQRLVYCGSFVSLLFLSYKYLMDGNIDACAISSFISGMSLNWWAESLKSM